MLWGLLGYKCYLGVEASDKAFQLAGVYQALGDPSVKGNGVENCLCFSYFQCFPSVVTEPEGGGGGFGFRGLAGTKAYRLPESWHVSVLETLKVRTKQNGKKLPGPLRGVQNDGRVGYF